METYESQTKERNRDILFNDEFSSWVERLLNLYAYSAYSANEQVFLFLSRKKYETSTVVSHELRASSELYPHTEWAHHHNAAIKGKWKKKRSKSNSRADLFTRAPTYGSGIRSYTFYATAAHISIYLNWNFQFYSAYFCSSTHDQQTNNNIIFRIIC